MSWLEMWWDDRCIALRNRPRPAPRDGAGWLALVIQLGKEGLVA